MGLKMIFQYEMVQKYTWVEDLTQFFTSDFLYKLLLA